MTETLRLVFVDEHELCRHELGELVETRAGMKILACLGKPDDARANNPELAIVDLRQRPSDGLGLLCQMKAPGVAAPVVVLPLPPRKTRNDARVAAEQGGEVVEIYPDPPRRRENPLPQLTEREWQILEHVMHGMSNKTIAKALAISHETVKLHVRHILAKLKVVSRVEAAVIAVELQMTRSVLPAARPATRTALRPMARGA